MTPARAGRRVGLTGGIGAGKSTVSAMLAERGAVIVDADQIARDLQSPGSPVLDAMAERFGAHIIGDDGVLDRGAVAAIVFNDKAALDDLNGIVHPAMQDEITRQIDEQRDTDRVVVLDFPLLGENPRKGLAATIVVDIPVDVAVERLVEQRQAIQFPFRHRRGEQGGVDFVVAQPFQQRIGQFFGKHQFHLRVLPLEWQQDQRHQVRTQRRDGADTQRSRQRVLLRLRQLPDAVCLFQDLPRMCEDRLTHRRDLHRAVGAFENHNTQFLFQLLDLPAQSRLADKTAFRRFTEVVVLRHRNHVFELL